jgi:hypothetical protein
LKRRVVHCGKAAVRGEESNAGILKVAVDDPQKLGRLLAAGSVRLNLVLSQAAL